MKALVGAFNQEKALVGAFSVITNLRMELFEALVLSPQSASTIYKILTVKYVPCSHLSQANLICTDTNLRGGSHTEPTRQNVDGSFHAYMCTPVHHFQHNSHHTHPKPSTKQLT